MSRRLSTLGNVIMVICMVIIGTVLQLSQSFVWADNILNPRISVETIQQSYDWNDEVYVDIKLRDTENIAALNTHILYDSEIFDVEEVIVNHEEFPDSVVKQDFNQHTISYVFGYAENLSEIENLLRIKFKVKDGAMVGKTEIKAEIIDSAVFSNDSSVTDIKPLRLQTENLSLNINPRVPQMIANSMPKSFLYNSSWDFIRGQLYAENHSDIDNDRFTKKASLKSLGTEKVNVAVPIPDRTNRKIVLLTLFVTFAIVYSVLTIKEKKYVYWMIALCVILPSYNVYASNQTDVVQAGDVNADGLVNVYDICQIKAYIAENQKVPITIQNADINGDGVIDTKDAILITRYVAGYHVSLEGVLTEDIYQNEEKYRQYLDENSYYDEFGNCVSDLDKQWCRMTYYVDISNSIDDYIYFNGADFPENNEVSVIYYGSKLEYVSSEKEILKSNRIKIPKNAVYVRMSFPEKELESLNVYIKTCEHTENRLVIEKEEIPAILQEEVGGLAYTYWVSPQVEVVDNDIFVGTVSKEGYTGVATIDKNNEKYSKNVMLEPTRADNHDSSSIMRDPVSEKLLCFTFEHDARNWINIYRSKEKDRARYFEYISRIYFPGSVTYAQVFYQGGYYHLFTRVDVTSWYWAKSTDLKHWDFQKLLMTDDPKGENRAVQYYIKFVTTNQPHILRMVMYSNPQAPDMSIRQGFLNLTNGTVYNSDGKTVIEVLPKYDALCQLQFETLIYKPIKEPQTIYRQRFLDVAPGLAPEDVRILYMYGEYVSADADSADIEYRMYINGEIQVVAKAGSYLWSKMSVPNGGVIADNGDTLYLSCRDVENATDYIYRYSYNKEKYEMDEQPFYTYRVPDEYRNNLLYDRYRVGFLSIDRESKALVWLEGYFNGTNYTDWNPEIKAMILK